MNTNPNPKHGFLFILSSVPSCCPYPHSSRFSHLLQTNQEASHLQASNSQAPYLQATSLQAQTLSQATLQKATIQEATLWEVPSSGGQQPCLKHMQQAILSCYWLNKSICFLFSCIVIFTTSYQRISIILSCTSMLFYDVVVKT